MKMQYENEFWNNLSSEEQADLICLYKAILTMENPDELHAFFSDLCSVNELKSMLHRWQIVLRIDQGMSYEEIIRKLTPPVGKTVSSTTISRVKNCYVNEEGGYRTALKRLKEQE